ncbi:unnamed protein product [Caenorhabditis sp. 36 PRJEB53466]|nr:unnamed protein product [Caenorhabditis sp. 36 PRJEB53466]
MEVVTIVGGVTAVTLIPKLIDWSLDKYRMLKAVRKFHTNRALTSTPSPPPKRIMDRAVAWEQGPDGWVGFTLGPENAQVANAESLVFIQDFLAKRNTKNRAPVPKNTLAVSMAQANFNVGSRAGEFVPTRGTDDDEGHSCVSYQMLSEHVQATYFHQNGVRFLAGLCFYLYPIGSKTMLLYNEEQTMREAFMMAEPFPLQDRHKNVYNRNYNRYGRYCKRSAKRVIVFAEPGKPAKHQQYDHLRTRRVYMDCEECDRDAGEYTFVEDRTMRHDCDKYHCFAFDPSHFDSNKSLATRPVPSATPPVAVAPSPPTPQQTFPRRNAPINPNRLPSVYSQSTFGDPLIGLGGIFYFTKCEHSGDSSVKLKRGKEVCKHYFYCPILETWRDIGCFDCDGVVEDVQLTSDEEYTPYPVYRPDPSLDIHATFYFKKCAYSGKTVLILKKGQRMSKHYFYCEISKRWRAVVCYDCDEQDRPDFETKRKSRKEKKRVVAKKQRAPKARETAVPSTSAAAAAEDSDYYDFAN